MRATPLAAAAIAALAVLSAPAAARTLAAGGSPWDKLEAKAPDRVTAKGGALQVVVKPGDSPTRSGERTEMVYSQARTRGYEGQTVTYEWSTRFPSGFRYVQSTWNLFAQWHQTDPDGCSPNLAVQVNAKKSPPVLRLQSRGGALDTGTCTPQLSPSWDFAPLRFDHWYDFRVKVRWSSDPAVGHVELWVDGELAVARQTTATLYPGQGVYFKQGFYRAPSSFTSKLFHTPVLMTPAAASRRRSTSP